VRDTGTHATVGGGRVLDVAPEGRTDWSRLAVRAAPPAGYLVGDEHARVLVARAEDDVRTYHRDAPDEPGIGREELRRRLGVPPSLFAAASSAPRSSRRRTSSGSPANARPRRAARIAGGRRPHAAARRGAARIAAPARRARARRTDRDGRAVRAIPLLEAMDAAGVTRRSGDLRS
jgi:hypothetical protein